MDQIKKLNAIIILLVIVVGLEVFNGIINRASFNLQSNISSAASTIPNMTKVPGIGDAPVGPHINSVAPQQLFVGGVLRVRGTGFTTTNNTLYFCLNTDSSCLGEYSGSIQNVSAAQSSQQLISLILPNAISPAQGDQTDNAIRRPIDHALTSGRYNFYIVNSYGRSNTISVSITNKQSDDTLRFNKNTELKLGAQKIFQDNKYSISFDSVTKDNRCTGGCTALSPKDPDYPQEAIVHLVLNQINTSQCSSAGSSDCANPAPADPVDIYLHMPASGGAVKYGPYIFSLNHLAPKAHPDNTQNYVATITVSK